MAKIVSTILAAMFFAIVILALLVIANFLVGLL